jgi:hypothetical protein
MSTLNVDTIGERTSGSGVTIDGVKLKDNAVETNTISEGTSGSGVTIDGVLLKDNFVAATAGGGLVKLASATASNSSALHLNSFVDQDTYSYYQVVFQHIKAANDNNNFRIRFKNSDGDVLGTYRQAGAYYYGDTTDNGFFYNNSSTNYQTLENNVGNSNAEGLTGKADLFPATGTDSTSAITAMHSLMSNQDNTDRVRSIHRSTYYEDGATAVTGFKVFMSSGNISSGTIVVYGVKK